MILFHYKYISFLMQTLFPFLIKFHYIFIIMVKKSIKNIMKNCSLFTKYDNPLKFR